MNSKTHIREIVQFGMDARYLQARKEVATKGMRLPPHPLLDRYVIRNRVRDGLLADELLAHPEKDCVFQKGRDVRDSLSGWIIPARYVPEEALGRQGVGLFVVPKEVEENGKVVIHPKSVIVLDGMIQVSDEWVPGKPHEITRIPLVISPEEFERLPYDEKRWFYRIAGEGVRLLVRGDYNSWIRSGRRYVDASCGPDIAFGVAGVLATEGGAPKKALQKLQV